MWCCRGRRWTHRQSPKSTFGTVDAHSQAITTSLSRAGSREIFRCFFVCVADPCFNVLQMVYRPRKNSLRESCCIRLLLKNGYLMARTTRRSSRSLMDPVDDLRKIARGRVAGTSTVPAQLSADDNRPKGCGEKKRSVKEQNNRAPIEERNLVWPSPFEGKIAEAIPGKRRCRDLASGGEQHHRSTPLGIHREIR